jgi:hypothetical protein
LVREPRPQYDENGRRVVNLAALQAGAERARARRHQTKAAMAAAGVKDEWPTESGS